MHVFLLPKMGFPLDSFGFPRNFQGVVPFVSPHIFLLRNSRTSSGVSTWLSTTMGGFGSSVSYSRSFRNSLKEIMEDQDARLDDDL